jgi:hypothetical protein
LPPLLLPTKEHKVCQQPAKIKTEESSLPFYTLQAGERFVTPYGTVEVVKDERAIPTATLPSNIKNLARNWQNSKGKLDAQLWKAHVSRSMRLRARRHMVNAQYGKRNVGQASIFYAYYGGDPRWQNTKQRTPLTRKLPNDPMAPEDSFSDRIVECLWIPDTRKRFQGDDAKNPTDIKGEAPKSNFTTRLFLRRRLLTEIYHEDCPSYACDDCGQRFTSFTGQRYHAKSSVCIQKNANEAEKKREREKNVDAGTQRLLNGETVATYEAPTATNAASKPDTRKNRKRIRKKKGLGMYPEVLISLGFNLIKEDMKFTENIKLPPKRVEVQLKEEEEDESIQGDLAVDQPEAVLFHLKRQLVEHQRGSDDQKYGSMYAEVFKSLGFKKPRKKRLKNEDENATGIVKRRRRVSVKPPPPPKPLPPIIDTRALADEVDSGRYPSMNRYKGEEYNDFCVLCRDGGELVCCDFCNNAEHMHCIRKKFTVKDPEPEDDFMCHKCIQYILQRRARAEKRRLQKQERDAKREQQEALEESRQNPDIKKGMEYQYLAAKGQEVSELVELLQDAEVRLKQSLATHKMNNVRRKIMGCYYNQPV